MNLNIYLKPLIKVDSSNLCENILVPFFFGYLEFSTDNLGFTKITSLKKRKRSSARDQYHKENIQNILMFVILNKDG